MVKQGYQQKWAVILGGSSGLGLATALKLASAGMHICIIHRTRRSALPAFKAACAKIRLEQVSLVDYNINALDAGKRAETIAELEGIIGKKQCKTLIHSIARGNLKPMHDNKQNTLSNQDFIGTIDAMAISFYDWVAAFAKAELFTNGGQAIAFTSEGSSRAWKSYGAVAAAKAALESITRNIALEFAPLGIRANCIKAGVTDTESLRMIPGSEQMKNESLKRNPYQRLTLPEDVANAVYLLCRDEALWINGAVIPVDGGEHIR